MSLMVQISPGQLSLAPGERMTVRVEVSNTSARTEHYAVSAVGLPEGAFFEPPEVLKLNPGAGGAVELTVAASEQAPPDAGSRVVGVLVQSPYRPQEVSRAAELRLEIKPVPALQLQVEPEVATGERTVGYRLTLRNPGNTRLSLHLTGRDPEASLQFDFAPPQLELAPGGLTQVDVRVAAPRPKGTNEVQRRITFTAFDGAVAAEAVATLVQPARPVRQKREGLAAVAMAVVAAAATLSAAAIAVTALTRSPKDAPSTPGTTTASGAGSTTSGAGGSSTDGSGKDTGGSSSDSNGGSSTDQNGGQDQGTTEPPPNGADFRQPLPGQLDGATIGAPGYPGVLLFPAAGPNDCAELDLLWFRTPEAGYVSPGDVSTGNRCTDASLTMALNIPAAIVTVRLLGCSASNEGEITYAVTIDTQADGSSTENVTVQAGDLATKTLQDASKIVQVTVTPAEPGLGGQVCVEFVTAS